MPQGRQKLVLPGLPITKERLIMNPNDWDSLLIDLVIALTGVLAGLTGMAVILTLAAADR